MTHDTWKRPTETWVSDRLSAEGIRVSKIEPISEKLDRFDVVFRVVTKSGETLYVRTLNEERAELLRSFVSSDVTMDMPETEIVEGDTPLLVMNAAKGTPLSFVLPVYLLPGLWKWRHTELGLGIRSLGANLGVLHAKTAEKTARFDESEIDSEKIQNVLADLDRLDFDPSLASMAMQAIADLRHTVVVHSKTHRDPAPHNVYYESGNIELIDFDLSIRPALVDVALADIGVRLMVARLPYARGGQETYLTDQFWAGYESAGIDVSPTDERYIATRIYQLCELQRNYVTQRISSPISRLTAFTDRSIIRDLVELDCLALGEAAGGR